MNAQKKAKKLANQEARKNERRERENARYQIFAKVSPNHKIEEFLAPCNDRDYLEGVIKNHVEHLHRFYSAVVFDRHSEQIVYWI